MNAKRTKALVMVLVMGMLMTLAPVTGTQAATEYYSALQQELTGMGLPAGTFLHGTTETAALAQYTTAGTYASQQLVDVTGMPFTKALRLTTTERGSNPWSAVTKALTNQTIEQDDLLLGVVYMRGISSDDETGVTDADFMMKDEQSGGSWWNESEAHMIGGNKWQKYYFHFKASRTVSAGQAWSEFHFGQRKQTFEVGGIAVINYGKSVTASQLPKTQYDLNYEGRDTNAAWRTEADSRIDQHRKGNLTVRVKDANGNNLSNASVNIEMKRHAFGWGTAVNNFYITDSGSDAQQYRQILKTYFNRATPENALKWPAWVGDWGSGFSKENSRQVVQWLNDNGLPVRGHALVWPSFYNSPSWLADYRNNPIGLFNQIKDHIAEEAGDAGLKGRIQEWDVLNEASGVREITDILDSNGYDSRPEWFKLARQADPDAKLFINDYSMIALNGNRTALHEVISSVIDGGGPVDGIGDQAHFLMQSVTPPTTIIDILNSFSVYDKPIHITEFDIQADRSDSFQVSAQADYTRDFLTAVFSHPSVTSVYAWGFWAGSHWKPDAAYFNSDWSIRPNGQAFIDLVYGTWWTREYNKLTDAAGSYSTRAFLGDYEITATYGGQTKIVNAVLPKDGAIVTVTMDQNNGGTATKLSGTAFGASPAYAAGSEFDKAFDGSTSTFFDYSSGSGGYTGIDLGAGNEKQVTKIRIHPRSGFAYRMTGGKLQGSNTSSSSGFVDLHTIAAEPTNAWTEFEINHTNSYRYLRYLSPDNGYGNVAEIEFFGVNAPTGGTTNMALNQPAIASTTESSDKTASKAADGNPNTRWASNSSDNEWLYVDLGSAKSIQRVKLMWETAYGKSYKIQTSNDAVNWTDIYSTTTGDGGVDDVIGLTGNGRYVRMLGVQRGTTWGYSLYEFEVYGN